MSIFDFLKSADINEKVKEFENSENAILLDVRTKEEYKHGHIKKSINIPLDRLSTVENHIEDKNTKIFVYCLSGGISTQAVHMVTSKNYST